jgi:hypothetical protein
VAALFSRLHFAEYHLPIHHHGTDFQLPSSLAARTSARRSGTVKSGPRLSLAFPPPRHCGYNRGMSPLLAAEFDFDLGRVGLVLAVSLAVAGLCACVILRYSKRKP